MRSPAIVSDLHSHFMKKIIFDTCSPIKDDEREQLGSYTSSLIDDDFHDPQAQIMSGFRYVEDDESITIRETFEIKVKRL